MSKKIYLVEEIGYYGTKENEPVDETRVLTHICATEKLAKKWLQKWIDENHPLEEDIETNRATCFYDELPWRTFVMERHQVSEKEYVDGGRYGSIEICKYYEAALEEEDDK